MRTGTLSKWQISHFGQQNPVSEYTNKYLVVVVIVNQSLSRGRPRITLRLCLLLLSVSTGIELSN